MAGVLVVRGDAPWKTFPELITAAKANPGTITYGTPCAGTTPHIAMEQIAKEQGAKLIHVPFKGVDGYRMLGFVAPNRRAPEQGFRTRR